MSDSKNISDSLFTENPGRIELYKIFHDISKKSLIDGKELVRNDWKRSQIERWLFFYRPWFSNLPQHKQIVSLKSICNRLLGQIDFIYKLIPVILFFFTFISALIYFNEDRALNDSLIFFYIGVALSAISQLLVYLKKHQIKTHKRKIISLNTEIKLLSKQLPAPRDRDKFDDDVKTLQCESLYEAVSNFEMGNMLPGLKKTKKPLKGSFASKLHEPTNNQCHKLLQTPMRRGVFILSGWAVHQNQNEQKSGTLPKLPSSRRILEILGEDELFKLWTWRVGKAGRPPLFRFPYYQILVVAPKGLISYGFFCDLVSANKPMGEKAEMFHYSHISNISREDVSPNELELGMSNLPEMIGKSVLESRSESVSFYVSSGKKFNCIFLSDETKNILNKLIDEQNKSNPDEGKVYEIRDDMDTQAKEFIRAVHRKLGLTKPVVR